MPGKRLALKYGTRFDAQIVSGIQRGDTLPEIGRRIGVSAYFVRTRGHALGLGEKIYANGCVARAKGGARGHLTARERRAFFSELHKSPGDRLVSDLARSLRAKPAALSDVAIAALHERGLTIDELCAGTDRHPITIIRVVREAAQCA